jgi:predicted DNA-binding ribbon-helix-helix protein
MRKRFVNLNGRKTGVSLEDDFWHAVKEIAAAQNISVQDLILKIDKERTHANLSSAIRLRILSYYRERFMRKVEATSRPTDDALQHAPAPTGRRASRGH